MYISTLSICCLAVLFNFALHAKFDQLCVSLRLLSICIVHAIAVGRASLEGNRLRGGGKGE